MRYLFVKAASENSFAGDSGREFAVHTMLTPSFYMRGGEIRPTHTTPTQ